MKCQKGKACVKQPEGSTEHLGDVEFCTGCEKPGKDKKTKRGKK